MLHHQGPATRSPGLNGRPRGAPLQWITRSGATRGRPSKSPVVAARWASPNSPIRPTGRVTQCAPRGASPGPDKHCGKIEICLSVQRQTASMFLDDDSSCVFRKFMIVSRRPTSMRGVRVVTDVEAGCDGRGGDARRASSARTAKSCGPGLPTLRSSFADTKREVTGARKPGPRGDHV